MRDINRIDDFCEKLKEIWKCNPDLRFYQVVELLARSIRKTGRDPYYVEDNCWEQAIQERFEESTNGKT